MRWAEWLSRVGDDGLTEARPATLADLQVALGTDPAAILLVLQSLDLVEETEMGWVLDRVTIGAATRIER